MKNKEQLDIFDSFVKKYEIEKHMIGKIRHNILFA